MTVTPQPQKPTLPVFVPGAKLDPSQVVDERSNTPSVAPKPKLEQWHPPTSNTPAHKIPKMPKKGTPNPHNIHK